MAPPFSARPYDIVIMGATGFSGKYLAEYLVEHYIKDAKFALAGRNQKKLEDVRRNLAKINPSAEKLPILIGDSSDLASLKVIAEQARVVASTVGPFAKYGTPLVEACARSGTSYCDITGESNWHATMFNRFETLADESGARIVHQAGFDSVPSDIGTFVVAQNFRERFKRDAERINMFITLRGGGVQGGTLDTLFNELANGGKMRKQQEETQKTAPPLPNVGKTTLAFIKGISWYPEVQKWGIPFFMAPTNMLYVSRSNGRLGYSAKLVYSEHMVFSSLPKALVVYSALLLTGVLLTIPPTRWLLRRFVLPAPGQGPSKETCEKASYTVMFCATGGGDRADVKLDAVGDASCISTTVCLAESAMALSMNTDKLKSPGGVMTAAAAMGDVLLDRLRSSGKFKIEPTEAWRK